MTAEGVGNAAWFHVCLSAAMEDTAPGGLLVFHRSLQEVFTLYRLEPGTPWWPEGPELGSKSDLPAWTLSVWVPSGFSGSSHSDSAAASVDGCRSS